MSTYQIILLVCAAIALVIYTVYVAMRVARSRSHTPGQKAAQIAIVLLIPLAGPLLLHAFHRTDSEEPAQRDKNFVPEDIDKAL